MTERDTSASRNKLLSPQEAAERIGVSARTLHRYQSKGLISAQKTPTGQRRYHPDEVERLIGDCVPAARTG